MGGDLWAESSGIPGEGSAFHFTIQTEAVEMPERTRRDLAGIQPHLEREACPDRGRQCHQPAHPDPAAAQLGHADP